MRKKIKVPLLIIAIISIATYITMLSCEDDFVKEPIKFGIKAKLRIEVHDSKHVFEKIKDLNKLLRSLNTNEKHNRLVSQTYQFEINEEFVQVINHVDFQTYTFEIIDSDCSSNILKNYIVKMDDGIILAHYLIEYPFTINPIDNSKMFSTTDVSLITLENPNWVPVMRLPGCPPGTFPELIGVETVTVTNIQLCSYGEHQQGQPCVCDNPANNCSPGVTTISYETVYKWGCAGGINYDGYDTGDPSSNTSSGGSVPHNGNTTTVVSVPFSINKNEIKDCEELKKNSDSNDFKTKMQILKDNIIGSNEKSFGLENGNYQTPSSTINPKTTNIYTGTTNNTASVPYNKSIKGLAHNHLKNSTAKHAGTFTQMDLLQLNDLLTLAENEQSQVKLSEFVYYLVCDEGNYCLKVNNFDKLYDFCVKYGTNIDFRMEVDEFFKRNNIKHGKPSKDQNIGFLKAMKNFNMGLDYYQSDENFENWSKLELNENQTDITKKPCKLL